MQITYFTLVLMLSFSLNSCKENKPTINPTINPIESALSSELPHIKNIMDSLEKHEIQIRYTQIDRRNDSLIFTDFDYQVNPNNYFYPSSTVKFPVAILALEKLNTIKEFDMHTNFFVEGDTLETTIAKEIFKVFSINDDAAYNRLFEFLGQDEINQQLALKGIKYARISERENTPNAADITTKSLVISINDSTTQISEKSINSPVAPLTLNRIAKGTAYYEDDRLLQEPFDFSLKNYYSIEAQDAVLKRIMFPDNFSKEQQFHISKDQRELLLEAMRTVPKELGYPEKEYHNSYGKFFIFGDRQTPMPNSIEIYNKTGFAYGTITDCAYIKDPKNQIDFMVTATILVNRNEVFNDNLYEYNTAGIPFLAELGRELYKQELQRIK